LDWVGTVANWAKQGAKKGQQAKNGLGPLGFRNHRGLDIGRIKTRGETGFRRLL